MLELKKQKRIFYYQYGLLNSSSAQTAMISFIKKEKEEKWVFDKVEYKTINTVYSLEDWSFLASINEKIHYLSGELN